MKITKKTIEVGEVAALLEATPLLRTVDRSILHLYAGMDLAKNVPVVGTIDGESEFYVVVDGAHRLTAWQEKSVGRDLQTLDCELRTYETRDEMLADMVKLNANRGQTIALKDLRKRFQILKINYKLTQSKIAQMCGMTQASVSRILADKQGAGAKNKSAPDVTISTLLLHVKRFNECLRVLKRPAEIGEDMRADLEVAAGMLSEGSKALKLLAS